VKVAPRESVYGRIVWTQQQLWEDGRWPASVADREQCREEAAEHRPDGNLGSAPERVDDFAIEQFPLPKAVSPSAGSWPVCALARTYTPAPMLYHAYMGVQI
jgi:hypothetical protein